MPATDLNEQITELRTLGDDFEAFHLRLAALSFQPGADAHEQISPLLLESQQLTARTLQQLTALTHGPYTQLPGSRYGLESLSAVLAGTALASADLACALSDNPYEGTNFAGSPPTVMLNRQAASAQLVAQSALSIVGTLNAQSMYHSPEIRAVYARVRQLAHLANDAADHLIDAVDILDHTVARLPVELGDGFLAVLTEHDARREAGRRFTLAASLTALGASDALATAELFIVERRNRGFVPEYQPPGLTTAQSTTLRAVARGEVAITHDKPYLRREDIRVSISTIRALENRGLVMREDCPDDWFRDERVHLTAAGRRDLAASFARPRPAALTTRRPAPPLPAPAAGRSR
ncbi:hypothetical protein OG897_17135 [Streptomyces sp. NBC_00237]|uniref:hypothetical protein n=1 Tax=Streptomyces sp. NBC_00237 TaxID=2975687 RepID=UPI0022544D3C|nr:hypothetical protein [Streptomyces sp. NBC_00237]MCX5203165.1 hypothetical protein [Streptomyces sp. NBC_00237]